MREIVNGSIIPNHIMQHVEVVLPNGKKEVRCALVEQFDYKTRAFQQFCMTERDIESKALAEFFNRTTMVMNIWEDPEHPRRWQGGRFTPEQYMDLVKRCQDPAYRHGSMTLVHGPELAALKKISAPSGEQKARIAQLESRIKGSSKVFVAQYGKAKWPTGGGRNAQAAGKFFFGTEDVLKDLYAKYLKVNTDRMNPRERVSRTSILFGNPSAFIDSVTGQQVNPRLVYADYETGGTVLVDRTFAERVGLHHGDKLWPIKASAMICDIKISGADMVVPKDAIKFKEHMESPVLLSSLMGWMPELTAQVRSSVENDRLPKMAFDTMQWLFPELNTLLGTDERLKDSLGVVRRVVEGTATLEETLSLAEYERNGEKAYPSMFYRLLNGHPKEDPEVRSAIMKVAGTAAFRALNFRVRGRYGVAMPLVSNEASEMTFLMPPWMCPMRAKGSYDIDHVIGVESDWAIGCLGKDYDGDLIMCLEIGGLLKKLGMTKEVFPAWSNPEDREWAKSFMSLPEKKKADEKRGVHQVMTDGIRSYGLIGQATNMCMVLIDTMRSTGLYTRRQLMGMYFHLMSIEVQPFVDALKYDPNELRMPRLCSKYDKRSNKLIYKGMAEKYGTDPKTWKVNPDGTIDPTSGTPIPGFELLATKVQAYFKAVRTMDFGLLAELPVNDELNGSFYYTLSRLFTGWVPFKPVDLNNAATYLAAKYPLPEVVDRARASSFTRFKSDKDANVVATKRWQSMSKMITNVELAVALIAKAWLKRDTRFALVVQRATGISLVQAVAGHLPEQLHIEAQETTSNEEGCVSAGSAAQKAAEPQMAMIA